MAAWDGCVPSQHCDAVVWWDRSRDARDGVSLANTVMQWCSWDGCVPSQHCDAVGWCIYVYVPHTTGGAISAFRHVLIRLENPPHLLLYSRGSRFSQIRNQHTAAVAFGMSKPNLR